MADTSKQVTIHKKYMISGGIGPIFGGKVTLTHYILVAHTHRSIVTAMLAHDAATLRRHPHGTFKCTPRGSYMTNLQHYNNYAENETW